MSKKAKDIGFKIDIFIPVFIVVFCFGFCSCAGAAPLNKTKIGKNAEPKAWQSVMLFNVSCDDLDKVLADKISNEELQMWSDSEKKFYLLVYDEEPGKTLPPGIKLDAEKGILKLSYPSVITEFQFNPLPDGDISVDIMGTENVKKGNFALNKNKGECGYKTIMFGGYQYDEKTNQKVEKSKIYICEVKGEGVAKKARWIEK
jgi:hypothetical protein